MVITVSDIGHKCSTGCTSLITSHSDSEEEDSEVQLNLPKKMGQDGTILIQGDVHEDEIIENTSVKTVVKSESLSELSADNCRLTSPCVFVLIARSQVQRAMMLFNVVTVKFGVTINEHGYHYIRYLRPYEQKVHM